MQLHAHTYPRVFLGLRNAGPSMLLRPRHAPVGRVTQWTCRCLNDDKRKPRRRHAGAASACGIQGADCDGKSLVSTRSSMSSVWICELSPEPLIVRVPRLRRLGSPKRIPVHSPYFTPSIQNRSAPSATVGELFMRTANSILCHTPFVRVGIGRTYGMVD